MATKIAVPWQDNPRFATNNMLMGKTPDNIGNYAGGGFGIMSAPGTSYSTGYGGASPFPTGGATNGASSSGASSGATGNPNSDAAVAYLNKVLSGKELPYDQATQANMLSDQSGMAAAAEAAQNAELMNNATANGAGANDPSLQAGKRSNMARRQSDNMGAQRNIAQNANVANFDAKSGAARTLATFGLAEQDRALQAMQRQSQTGYPFSQPGGWQAAQSGQAQQAVGGGTTSPFPSVPSAQMNHTGLYSTADQLRRKQATYQPGGQNFTGPLPY